MTDLGHLDREPLIVVIAGPNGAGKTTFYDSQLGLAAYRFLNAAIHGRRLGRCRSD